MPNAMMEGGGYGLPQVPYQMGKEPVQYVPPSLRPPSSKPKSTKKKATKKKKTGSSGSSGSSYSGGGSSYSGGGGGGGGYSTKSVGSTATGQIAPVAPSVPTLEQFLGADSSYQDQIAQFNKAWSDYQAQNNAELGQYNTNYARNKNDLGIQQGRADEDLQNDFASRGMFISGLQAQDRGKLLDDYSRRFSDLDTARSQFTADQARDMSNYQSEINLGKNKAKTDAINRRALKYQV